MKIAKQLEPYYMHLLFIVVTALFALIMFGTAAGKMVLGIVVFSLPFYYFFDRYKLPESERVVFSIVLGITLIPSMAFLLGFIIPFSAGLIAAIVILSILAYWSNNQGKKK